MEENIENKFYTPTIDDTNIGFEYEVEMFKGDNDWMKVIMPSDLGGYIQHIERFWLFPTTVRVKYLDKEDIESLGFNEYESPMEYNHSWKYKGSKEPKLFVWFNKTVPLVRIYGSFPQILFQGEIKNKSELKKLMQQLGI